MEQELESSRFSRELVNLFIGMSMGSPDLPTGIRDAGYTCHSIEQTLPVSANKFASPELILISVHQSHSLLIEAKSGANLNQEQLQRYFLIASVSLSQAAQVPPPADRAYTVLVIGKSQHQERLLIGNALLYDPHRALCLRADEGLLCLDGGALPSALKALLDPSLPINWESVPYRYFPVDVESHDWQFAEYLLPDVMVYALNGAGEVGIDELAKLTVMHWDFVAASYRKRLRTRMLEVLRRAAGHRFRPFFRVTNHKGINAKVLFLANEAKTRSPLSTRLNQRLRLFMEDLASPQMEFPYSDPEVQDEVTSQ